MMTSLKPPLQANYSRTKRRVFVLLGAWLMVGVCIYSPHLSAQEVEDQVSEIVSDLTEERIEQVMEDLLADIESRITEDSLRIQTDH